MRKLLIRPKARQDLLEIWHHIAGDSVNAATRVTERIDMAIQGLREMPGKGHHRADVSKASYRFWSVHSYVIAYRYNAVTLTIIRVVHGRRDFRKLFRP